MTRVHAPRQVVLTTEDVERILGPAKYDNDEVEGQLQMPGVALGLAYTPFGGDLLFIEASKYAGNGAVKVTGNVQNVMSESVSIAVAWVRAHAFQLGITGAITEDPLKVRTRTSREERHRQTMRAEEETARAAA